MDLNYTDAEKNFRDEVRNWLRENLPESLSNKVRKHLRLTSFYRYARTADGVGSAFL